MSKDNAILLGLAAAMAAVAALAVYVPQHLRLEEYRSQALAQQAVLDDEAHKVAVVPELIRQVQTLKDRYGDFDRRLPKRQELHEFLKQVNSALTRSDLANLSIEPGNPTREEYFHTLPIVMKFRTDYLTLSSFLDQLEGMQRLSRVQRLVLHREEKDQELSVELQMSIFFTES